MAKLNERGARSERGSALWGTGGRGGDRSSVLWGKGGRGMVVSFVLVVALAAPLAATAGNGKKNPAPTTPTTTTTTTTTTSAPDPGPAPDASGGSGQKTWISPRLTSDAKGHPNDKVDVIIMATGGFQAAGRAEKWLAKAAASSSDVTAGPDLSLVSGIEVHIRASLVAKLASVPGLIVVPNSTVQVSGVTAPALAATTSQLWPYASGNALVWPGDQLLYSNKLPAIAVVDSGIQNRADFGNRLLASVNLSTIAGNTSMNDDAGHGTFVASIAAGAAGGLAGAAPTAPLVSIKVMDANGQAKTSDVIAACQWILDHKDQYNIRVANFSLHSSYSTNFYRDPLDMAVEKLWFNGVTVVAASGNYGTSNTTPSGVNYSPGNDPFVITVGAVDLNGTVSSRDDAAAPWSAWGHTHDGFAKPEISAPGRYMVGAVPAGSTLTQVKASNMVGTDRIQLSGTSFAAPVVSGTVAQILARHPNWTPDQVKGDLMRTARRVPNGAKGSAGLGELTASRAVASNVAPNPNAGLDRFLKSGLNGATGTAFDAMSWANAAKSDMSWNSMSWTDVMSWTDMSWTDQSWSDMSWTDMSWTDMSWTDMSWTDMSAADMSQEDAAEGDSITGEAGYVATPDQVDAVASDPDQVSVDGIPVTAVTGTDGTAGTTTDSTTTDTTSTTDSSGTTDATSDASGTNTAP
jgi:serine protease AprX